MDTYLDGDVHMLSNHKLNALGRKLIGPDFRGAVDANGLPETDGRKQYVIVNSKVAPTPGHWVAFYRSPQGHLYYYDSYSMPLRHYFKHWPVTRVQQADVTDREQLSVHLGDREEQKNCGALALTWLLVVKEHGIDVAMRV